MNLSRRKLMLLNSCKHQILSKCLRILERGNRYNLAQIQTRAQYVPKSEPVTDAEVDNLRKFMTENNKILVITGAGISTESGIPDYRSEGVGLYSRSTNRPVQYQDFIKCASIRQRYWARNFVGWPVFSSFLPNISHKILKKWEDTGKLHWLVTQNVDALHTKAGSRRVTELHGCAHRVVCLNCDSILLRTEVQDIIQKKNPGWHAESIQIAPDGDVQLTSEQIHGFQVPVCPNCNGVLKPEIVFFGDNVPKPTVNFVFEKLRESNAIFVVGSSLEVYSGYRFVSAARDQGKPIVVLNIGPTRADKITDVKVSARCSHVLESLQ